MKYDKEEGRWYTDEDYISNQKKKFLPKYLRGFTIEKSDPLIELIIRIILFLLFVFVVYNYTHTDSTTYTLYRNSSSLLPDGELMRIHIATFDTNESDGELSYSGVGNKDSNEAYNKAECELAASLFQNQKGVRTKFWCEKGRFHK